MTAILRYVRDNPVLVRELRTRMRGNRSAWILFGYLAFLGITVWLQVATSSAFSVLGGWGKMGANMFSWLYIAQLVLVGLITPAITCGAITTEREQRTWELMEMTRMTRGVIVAGKLFSALLYSSVLIFSSLPIVAVSFLLGGVSPEEVARGYASLLAMAMLSGSLGVAWSAISRTTQQAIGSTYGMLIMPQIGIWFFMISAQVFGSNSLVNIYVAMAFAAPGTLGGYSGSGGILQWWDTSHYFGFTLPGWVHPITLSILICAVLGAVASARLETYPERKGFLLRGLTALLVLAMFWFLFGARFSALSSSAPASVASSAAGLPIGGVWYVVAVMMMILTAVFCTGVHSELDIASPGKLVREMFSIRTLGISRPAGGLLFLWLILGATCLLYMASFIAVGQRAGIIGSAQVVGAAIPGGWFSSVVCIAASILGFGTLGLLFSAVLKNRWSAMMLLGFCMVLTAVVPAVSAGRHASDPNQFGISLGLGASYWNPAAAIGEQISTPGSTVLPMPLGSVPVRTVLPPAHLLLAGFSLFGLSLVSRSGTRRQRTVQVSPKVGAKI